MTTNAFGVDDARALLERHGIEAEIWETEHPGHATELARKAAEAGFARVIAAGGDGTVEEAAEGLVGTEVELGILPLGSIMNIARMLGVPREIDAAARVIKEGRVARIDVGRARTRARSEFFIEAAGVGIDAGLFAYFNQIDQGNWRSLRPLLTFMWRYRSRRVTLVADGRRFRFRAMMVSVANGPYVGAALSVAPDALLDDRRLDVRVFTRFGKFELLRHVLRIAGGRRADNPKVKTIRARSVQISSDRPMMVHGDSRPLGTTPARFEVVPSSLSVIVGDDPGCLPALVHVPPAQRADRPEPVTPATEPDGTIPDAEASGARITAVLATKPPSSDSPANEPPVGAPD
jgi:YegS/Rv2252/BmrU family lipid kinase